MLLHREEMNEFKRVGCESVFCLGEQL